MIAQLVNRIAYAASLHFDVLTPPRTANPFRLFCALTTSVSSLPLSPA
jgi:hypothetical protein